MGLTSNPAMLAQLAKTLFQGQPPGQNPLYPPPDASQGAPSAQSQPVSAPPSAPTPSTPSPSPGAPQAAPSGASLLYGNSAQPPAPAPSGVQPGQLSAAMKPPMSSQEFAAANPDASKPYMPARPVGDFDTGKHPMLRRILANLFAGTAEFGGELNHHPGMGTPFFERWAQQDQGQRTYDNPQNQGRMQSGALQQAYQNYLQQGAEKATIEHTQAETGNLRANVPLLQHQQQFLDKVRTLKESGKYQNDEDLLNSVLPEAGTIPGMTRQMILDQIGNAKTLGAKFNVQTDKQGRPEFVQTPSGQKVYPDANGKFPDPEMQKQWDSEMASHQQGLLEEEGKEKRVAGYAADRQAQAFANTQTAEGRKAAQPHLNDINDAKNQQDMMEKLTSGKMNPASQTAAMFKMIGLEQPAGTHRIMPAEIEGIEQMGGLSDRLKQKLLNWKSGDRFSPDLVPDLMQTAKILTQNKIKTANDNLASTYQNTGYKVPGSDAKGRLDKPGDYQDQNTDQGGKQKPQGATHTGIGSVDKKKHWLDAKGNDLGVAE